MSNWELGKFVLGSIIGTVIGTALVVFGWLLVERKYPR